MNNTHLNKISKCVDKTNQFTIQSYWINDTVNSSKISKSDIDLQSTPINNINTPILHKIKLQLMVQSDSGENCTLINDLDLLSDVHDIPNRTFATCNTSDTSNIISNKAGYILCRNDTGHLIRTKVYYAKETDGTVLSPTAITKKTTIGSMVGYNKLTTTLKPVELFLLAAPAILILRSALSVIIICGIMILMN